MPRPRPSRRLALLLACSGGVFACRSAQSVDPVGLALNEVRTGAPRRCWQLLGDGRALGVVVEFADPSWPDDPARSFYSVRNPWQQELGTVDAFGRAYRFVPHEREARWLGTGTLLEGARAIVGAGSAAELVELPLEALRGAG